MKAFRWIFVGLAGFMLLSCRGSMEMTSPWRDTSIAIDGNNSDWLDATKLLEEYRVSVGVRNDEQNLYFCITTTDPSVQMQMVAMGFTVWLNPGEAKEKTFGIHFPKGFMSRPTRMMPRIDEPTLRNLLMTERQEFEILGPNADDRVRIPMLEGRGVKVSAELSGNLFAYELQVPLREALEHPYAVGIDTSSSLTIMLETPELERRMQSSGGLRSATSTRPAGRGRGAPSGGSDASAGSQERPKSLNLALKVLLSRKP